MYMYIYQTSLLFYQSFAFITASFHRECTRSTTIGSDGPRNALVIAKVLYAIVATGSGRWYSPCDSSQTFSQEHISMVPLKPAIVRIGLGSIMKAYNISDVGFTLGIKLLTCIHAACT